MPIDAIVPSKATTQNSQEGWGHKTNFAFRETEGRKVRFYGVREICETNPIKSPQQKRPEEWT